MKRNRSGGCCTWRTFLWYWTEIAWEKIWAMIWDFQRCWILTSADSDEPELPPLRLRNSKWCSVTSLPFIEYASDKQRLWSDCAYAQAGLSLCWSLIQHCWKSHVTAHIKRDTHWYDLTTWQCSQVYGSMYRHRHFTTYRTKNRGNLVVHSLSYLKHIIDIGYPSIWGVASTCMTPVGHTQDDMAYLCSLNPPPFLMKCNNKFMEKYKGSHIFGSAYVKYFQHVNMLHQS